MLFRSQVDAAKLWCNYLVSFHTDAAGDKNNDGRGYTGSMLCYSRHDPEGRRLGETIQKRMKDDFNWPIAGEQERGGTLYVLDGLPQPSLLLELGNHSDPEDCQALLNQQDDFCTAIAWGIFNHFGVNPKPTKSMEGEDDMRIIAISNDTNTWYLTDGIYKRLIKTGEDAEELVDAGLVSNKRVDGRITPKYLPHVLSAAKRVGSWW